MRALITGGAGFIGSHLADALTARGDSVIVLDDLSTGVESNLQQARLTRRLQFHRGTATDERLLDRLCGHVDMVFHLAAAVGVRLIIDQPIRTIETNLRATEAVLHAAARWEVPTVIASTSEVYGKSANPPFHEDQDLHLGPTTKSRWSYACSKAMDEWMAFAWAQEKGLPVMVPRFFNTVGPRQSGRYGMVLPTFAKQALTGAPITIYGDGHQSRSFCHVRDTVTALLKLVDNEAAWGQVVNVGSSEEVEIRALAELVRERANSKSSLSFISYDSAYVSGFEDMQRRVPDLKRLLNLTDFTPRTPLISIVDEVLEDQAGSQKEANAPE